MPKEDPKGGMQAVKTHPAAPSLPLQTTVPCEPASREPVSTKPALHVRTRIEPGPVPEPWATPEASVGYLRGGDGRQRRNSPARRSMCREVVPTSKSWICACDRSSSLLGVGLATASVNY